jgi:hypothetical protein
MDGCLRLNVVDDDALLILKFDVRGNFTINDFFENRLGHGRLSYSRKRRKQVQPKNASVTCANGKARPISCD